MCLSYYLPTTVPPILDPKGTKKPFFFKNIKQFFPFSLIFNPAEQTFL